MSEDNALVGVYGEVHIVYFFESSGIILYCISGLLLILLHFVDLILTITLWLKYIYHLLEPSHIKAEAQQRLKKFAELSFPEVAEQVFDPGNLTSNTVLTCEDCLLDSFYF